MASAVASATMAATGMDKKTSAALCSSTLQTPGSGTFPSSLRSPSLYSPGFKEPLKTPITPPSAYLDFLKNMTPAMMSPMSTSTSSRFHFNEKESTSTPDTVPALSRNTSYNSDVSTTSSSTTVSHQSITLSTSNTSASRTRPESPRIVIPPSPFVKPGPRSARTPRRIQIPQSPSSAQSPLSATPWSASFSPRDADPEINGKPGRVSVRHVVTRTVTYCRTPLEPAPRGKRRKLDGDAPITAFARLAEEPMIQSEDETTPKKSDTVPVIKQENDDAPVSKS